MHYSERGLPPRMKEAPDSMPTPPALETKVTNKLQGIIRPSNETERGIQNRQEALGRLLNGHHPSTYLNLKGPEIVMGKRYSPDVTVLVPYHDSADRIANAPKLFNSLKDQGQNIQIVVADNGMSADGVERVRAVVKEVGLPLTIVDASPKNEVDRSPAYARNKGLAAISVLRENDESLRGPVMEVDSDNVLYPGVTKSLKETLDRHSDAVAVTGNIVPVIDLNRETLRTHKKFAEKALTDGKIRVLPSLWSEDGAIDLASIVAFSSQIAGKTSGIMIDPDALFEVTQYSQGVLYVPMPNKSAEDMIASAAFSRHGRIYYDARATILDEGRGSIKQTQEQQMKWGRDHAILANDLNRVGLTRPGLHILEPRDGAWAEWIVPNTEYMTGYVVNPHDVRRTAEALGHDITIGNGLTRFNTHEAVDMLRGGLEIVNNVTQKIEQARPNANMRARFDLPIPIPQDPTSPRFTEHARTARLAGNVLGLSDTIQNIDHYRRTNTLPPVLMLGGRQAGSWNI